MAQAVVPVADLADRDIRGGVQDNSYRQKWYLPRDCCADCLLLPF